MSEIDGTTFSRAGTATADSLTHAFILHPVACGLAFLAGFAAIGGWFGSLIATMLALLAWVITLVVMVVDFVVFGVRFKTLSLHRRFANIASRSSKTMSTKMGVDRMPYTR
jgi:hypothetical protein